MRVPNARSVPNASRKPNARAHPIALQGDEKYFTKVAEPIALVDRYMVRW